MPKKYFTDEELSADFQPGSRRRVLRNRLGIISKKEMDKKEFFSLMKTQQDYYKVISRNTVFTAKLIIKMHRYFLGKIYDWAGKYRTVNLERDGFRWPPAFLVEKNMKDFEVNILRRYTPCRPGDLNSVSKAIAIVHSELLLIHPFRDGNGRIARLIADLMALQTEYPALDFAFNRKPNREAYLKALLDGYSGNYAPLTEIIKAAIKRSVKKLTH
jgi:cell filamentation protein